MTAAELSAHSNTVLWGIFFISMAFGAVAQRTHFCTMGAISDWFNFGDTGRLKAWGLAVAVAMLGFAGMAAAGWINPAQSLYASARVLWASAAVGGLMFGFGMVLASGCGSKTLLRLGAGSLKALVVFIVLGLSAFATLKGITAVLRTNTVDAWVLSAPAPASLPSLLAGISGAGFSLLHWQLIAAGVIGAGLLLWVLWRPSQLGADNAIAGAGVGLSVLAAWYVSGHYGYLAEHPETLQATFLTTNSGRMEALSFVAPIAHTLDWLMFFSDKSKVLSLGLVSVVGVIAGSALVSLVTRSFRFEGLSGTEDTANHIVGAVLMGVGGVTAIGCTVGQGLSGLSTLSLTSFVAVVAIVCGAVLGFKYQNWRLERNA